METMQFSGSSHPRAKNYRQGLIASYLGVALLFLFLLLAIYQAGKEESVLGWILAGIILAWLALAAYVTRFVVGQYKSSQAAYRQVSQEQPEAGQSMLDQKLAHSFQIILVQAKVIAEQRQQPGSEAKELIDRALDTINTTAHNGMGMIKDAEAK